MVALGYSQIPGIAFTKMFAPVVNDVPFRIGLKRMMAENLDSMLMDVESAFLYGELDEEIYMEVPVGINEVNPNSIKKETHLFPVEKGNILILSSSKTILEEIC